MFAFSKYRLKNFNMPLFLTVAALSILGYTVLQSALVNDPEGPADIKRQLLGFLGGAAVMLFLTLVDYHFWLKLHGLIYIGINGLLALLFTSMGKNINGATRWLEIHRSIPRIQPSEFAKVGIVIFFAWFFGKYKDKMNRFTTVVMSLAFFAVPAFLIFKEPDLSTTGTFAVLFLTVYFIAGISWKWIGIMFLSLIPLGGLLVWDSMQENPKVLKRYMLNRIMSRLYPDDPEFVSSGINDQQNKASMAISSGRFQGKGLFNSDFESVKNGNFLSEENSDFIFAVVGEELGFVGTCAVILLFALLVFICLRAASKAPDIQGRIICVGMGTLIGLQVFINIGVCSGLLPNTGVVLPFFSSGVSSLICVFAALGFVMNVSLQKPELETEW